MHMESGLKPPVKFVCLSAILLASTQCIAPAAWAGSVGEKMGESTRLISDGFTSVYKTVESTALNSVNSAGIHAESLQRSVNNLTIEINQGYYNFIYDFQKGYYK